MRSPVSVSSRATMAALPGDAGGDDVRQSVGLVRRHRPRIPLKPAEEGRIAEQAVLGGLHIAGAELALRQRRQQADVGQHQARLMEGADQVLALRPC